MGSNYYALGVLAIISGAFMALTWVIQYCLWKGYHSEEEAQEAEAHELRATSEIS